MKKQATISQGVISFKNFLFHHKRNKTILTLAGIAIVLQFVIYKCIYPFASFIHGDSFSYIEGAYYNLSINTYMVGYSMFLRFFSVFTTSDTILVAFQYLLIQSSAILFIFTLFYLFKPGKWVQILLTCFMVLNPLLFYLSNLISSDGLFVSLSLLWFTLLLWIIHSPNKSIILMHAIVLFLAFTVRYNALIYPIISIIVILLSRLNSLNKFIACASGLLLCSVFIFKTSYEYKKLTGYWQYSPFSGWQLANNAMYAYRYVDRKNRKDVPTKFKALDRMITNYFDSTRDTKKFPIESVMASTVYMWTPSLPLYKYRDSLFNRKDSSANELKRWSSMGPIYSQYGFHIIKKYPLHYLRYFIWPNANKYFAPPLEFLGIYNSGKDYVLPYGKIWFKYKNDKVTTGMSDKNIAVLGFYPILSGIINIVMLCVFLFYITFKNKQRTKNFSKGIYLAFSFWALNAAFTICASSAALRFQSFPLLITFAFVLLLIDCLCRLLIESEATTRTNTTIDHLQTIPI